MTGNNPIRIYRIRCNICIGDLEMVTNEIINTMVESCIKPYYCEGKLLMRPIHETVSGYEGGVTYLLVGATISSSRKSFHYTYTSNVEKYFPEGVKWDPEKKTLYVKSAFPGSFIGRAGCNIKELQRIWRENGFNIELMR